jgi:hypoxanthine-DNA glycosylase
MFVTSFPPIVGNEPRILILGSMPGGESLRKGQYYAHPRNLFWPMMRVLCQAGPELPYERRLERLQACGVALWDVLQHCEREGSLDSSIRVESEVPNPLGEFLSEHASLRLTAFNGQKSAQTFARRVTPRLSDEVRRRVTFIALPSTSPANAYRTWEQKLSAWETALRPYLKS